METLRQFLQNESGAVTVDWVVLTAAVIGLGTAVVGSVASGAISLSADVSSSISDVKDYMPSWIFQGKSFAEYVAESAIEGEPEQTSIYRAWHRIEATAPEGYAFFDYVTTDGDLPVYVKLVEADDGTKVFGDTLLIGGIEVDRALLNNGIDLTELE